MESKSEILSKLYALRASLSQMSILKEKCDEIDENAKNIKINDFDRKKCQENISGLDKENGSVRGQIFREEQEIQNIEEDIAKAKKDIKEANNKSTLKNKWAIIGLAFLVPICLFLMYCFLGAVIDGWFGDGEFYVFGIRILHIFLFTFSLGCGSGTGVVYAIFAIIENAEAIKDKKKLIETKKDLIAKNKSKISKCEYSIKEYLQQIDKIKKDVSKCKEQKELIGKKLDCKAEEERTKKIPLKREFILLNSVTEMGYKDFLDIRDWSKLDLIIYYIETGRAESIKEALLLVDTETRFTELKKLIVVACNTLCQTIRNSFNELKIEIRNGISHLSSKIDDIAKIVKTNNETILDKLSSLGASIDLNNALQSKIAVASSQLVKDMEYMKECSKQENKDSTYIKTAIENAEIRRRNNITS